MEAKCTTCGNPLEVAEGGGQWCRSCGIVAPRATPEDARCALHEENRADGVCERCGNFMCRLCRIPVEGRVYCPACFELLRKRGAFSQDTARAATTALILSLVSIPAIFLYCLGIPASGVALVMGLKALGQMKDRPDSPGRPRAVAAVWISSLTLVAVAGLIGSCLINYPRY